MPRLVYLLGLGMILVALAFLVTDRLLYPPGITEANMRRIRPGMTRREVERIFCRRPDCGVRVIAAKAEDDSDLALIWKRNDGFSCAVIFDPRGRTEGGVWIKGKHHPYPPGPLDRLRAWLGW
jgi:hypothetical protein